MEAERGSRRFVRKEPGDKKKNLFEKMFGLWRPQAWRSSDFGRLGNVSHTQRLKRWFDFKRQAEKVVRYKSPVVNFNFYFFYAPKDQFWL